MQKNNSMSADAFALLGAEASPGGTPAQATVRRDRRAKSRAPAAWLLSLLLVALLILPALYPGAFLRHALLAFGDTEFGTPGRPAVHQVAPRVDQLRHGS